MMYSNKLVCSVKSNNKILREKIQDGTSYVYLPFGSEYSLLLKNLAGRNAVVHIQIDGKEVSKNGIYMTAGKEGEITGFIRGFVAERKFKFIQKTQEISDFRGDKIDDGMIRVTWQFEAPLPEKKIVHIEEHRYPGRRWIYCHFCKRWHYSDDYCYFTFPPVWHYDHTVTYGPLNVNSGGRGFSSGGNIGCATNSSSSVGDITASCYTASVSSDNFIKSAEVKLDEGITVEGSKSGQTFNNAYARELENETHSMVIVLKGYTGKNEPVRKPFTVKTKKQCSSCGRMCKGNMEFCPNCGTALRS